MVPRSRSRTMALAVRIEVRANKIMPITPGIMKWALTRSGLYHTVVRTSSGGVMALSRPRCARRACKTSVECAWPINIAAESAVEATVGSEPSSTKMTCAEPPEAISSL